MSSEQMTDRDLAKKFYTEEDDYDECRDWVDILTRAIAHARNEERERCARIAEADGATAVGQRIAAAIRGAMRMPDDHPQSTISIPTWQTEISAAQTALLEQGWIAYHDGTSNKLMPAFPNIEDRRWWLKGWYAARQANERNDA